jgi:hypothetical protein
MISTGLRNCSTLGDRVAIVGGMSFRPASSALIAAAAFAIPATALATEDFFEPRGLGMGGAVRILGGDTSGVHLNPAVVAQNALYLSSASYQHSINEKGHRFSIGASDGKTSAFGMGTKYTIHTYEPPFDPSLDVRWYKPDDLDLEDRRTMHRWDVALAYGFLERKINVGVTARVLRQDNEIRDSVTKFTLDAGATFWPIEIFGFGVSAANLIPTTLIRHPVRVSPGIALKIGDLFRFGLDGVFDFTSSSVVNYIDIHAGAEIVAAQFLGVRFGYYSDRKFTDHYVTWGLGFTLNKLRIDWGMRIQAGELTMRQREDRPEGANRVVFSFGVELAL